LRRCSVNCVCSLGFSDLMTTVAYWETGIRCGFDRGHGGLRPAGIPRAGTRNTYSLRKSVGNLMVKAGVLTGSLLSPAQTLNLSAEPLVFDSGCVRGYPFTKSCCFLWISRHVKTGRAFTPIHPGCSSTFSKLFRRHPSKACRRDGAFGTTTLWSKLRRHAIVPNSTRVLARDATAMPSRRLCRRSGRAVCSNWQFPFWTGRARAG